jgi:hypothetical protein
MAFVDDRVRLREVQDWLLDLLVQQDEATGLRDWARLRALEPRIEAARAMRNSLKRSGMRPLPESPDIDYGDKAAVMAVAKDFVCRMGSRTLRYLRSQACMAAEAGDQRSSKAWEDIAEAATRLL